MVGTFVHGKIADRLGRRMVPLLLDAGPLLIGYGIEVPFYIAEISPQNLRGAFTTVNKVIGMFFISESPRWLAKIGLWEDCESALHRLRGKNAKIFEEAAEIRVTQIISLEFHFFNNMLLYYEL
ncbi:putative MFS transporter superfamily [Helianthus annuus]|nr:putative MFS transporter superfamily [Helianthus annuus]